jgi:FlaA1/EpsC-like NDP-sugar epimerase
MTGCTHVIHAAALKRIEVGQYNPTEMVKTNIDGAMNVIEAAQDAGVKRVVALSSDKAYQPISPYGQSKALAESLFLAANDTVGPGGPSFAVTRYGNVWWSAGSVGPRWWKISRETRAVPVTDPQCTRFFMRMSEACNLVYQAMQDGRMLIPDLPSYDLATLAEAFGADMEVVGLPAWEKRHESMSDELCSANARRMSIDELRDAIREAVISAREAACNGQ